MTLARNDPRHGTANGYSNLGCRCPRCRAAWNAYYTERAYRLGYRRTMADYLAERYPFPPPHGTESRYTNQGCRCSKCRKAANAARHWRRCNNPDVTVHNRNGYTNGCRCDICREANNAYWRERRRKLKAAA